jgi:hypothetical protein
MYSSFSSGESSSKPGGAERLKYTIGLRHLRLKLRGQGHAGVAMR